MPNSPDIGVNQWLTDAQTEIHRLKRNSTGLSSNSFPEPLTFPKLTHQQHTVRQTLDFRMLSTLVLLLFVSQLQLSYTQIIRLSDNTPKGTLITARILPGLAGDQLTYSLLQSKASSYFTVHNRTGQLSSVRLIDRDLLCAESELCCITTPVAPTYSSSRSIDFGHSSDQQTCMFNLSVSVVSSPGQKPDIHEVTIMVQEENDHIPVFKLPGPARSSAGFVDPADLHSSSYVVNISESAPVGHLVRLPLAEDIDAPPFQVQRYVLERLDSPADSQSHRSVPSPFKLKTIPDLGEKPGPGTFHSDPFGQNKLTSSSIVGLELELIHPLDRETVAQHNYRIFAIDGGRPPRTGTLLLQVRVLDTNDHAPRFTQPVYEVTVDESVVGKEIVQVRATDADEGPNGLVRYDWLEAANWGSAMGTNNQTIEQSSIADPVSGQLDPARTHPSYWFRLNSDTGSISTHRPLDYEQRTQHRFQIIAYNPIARHANLGDSVFRSMTATASVIVHVHNLDDEASRIVIDYATGNQNDYKQVHENQPAPYFVAFITVDDPDLSDDSSPYAGGRRMHLIDSSAVTCHLDPVQDFYRLERDSGNMKSSTVRYSLFTRAPLDRERSAEDRIRIVCQDSGSPSKTATAVATVKILDENDCTPTLQVFSTFPIHGSSANPISSWPIHKLRNLVKEIPEASQLVAAYMSAVPVHTVRVSENQPTGTIFARIRAIDNDAGENARVTFELPKSNELVNVSDEYSRTGQLAHFQAGLHGKLEFPVNREALDYFHIDQTSGDLSTRKPIDREEGFTIFEQIFLLVKATDHGTPVERSAFVLLDVRIMDENDNPPTFLEPKMRFDIQERVPAPAIVGEIRVVDPDIQPLSVAVDEASLNHPHQQSARLATLTSWNDPVTVTRNRLLLRIDPGHGRRDLPFILYRNSEGRFFLNTTRELDRETDEAFQFTIIATDADSSSIPGVPGSKFGHTVTASVSVTVLDVNDNFPEIIFPNPSTSNSTVHRVSYREYVGYEIISINANDRDAGDQNGKFHFELVPDSKSVELFTINRNTGLLQTRRQLTKDDLGEHVLQVIVRDEGSPPLETRLTLRLLVDQSEPHRPGDARTNPNLNVADYEQQRSLWGARTHEGGAAIKELSTRPFHTDILLSVIVAMILVLLLITFGLCLYLRRKTNTFTMVPEFCSNICASANPMDPGNRSLERKSIYMKNHLDLERCCGVVQPRQPQEHHARQNLNCHPDSYKEVTGKLLNGRDPHKLELFGPSSPHGSFEAPPNNQHGKMHRHQRPLSPQLTRDQFHSSLNLANPYGGFVTKDTGDVRPNLPFSPTLIGSEGLFQPITSQYRPGTAMAVNIPDVAGQAESQRAQYIGYCQTGHPAMAFSPVMNKNMNGVLFAPVNGRTNAYNVGGMYETRRLTPGYVNNQQEMTKLQGTFPRIPTSDFRSIQDDLHLYQYIYQEPENSSGQKLRRVYGTTDGMKPSATVDQRRNKKAQRYQPDYQEDANCSTPLTAWRSDPSLNQGLDGRTTELTDTAPDGSKSFRRQKNKTGDEPLRSSVKYAGRSGQGNRKTAQYSTLHKSHKLSPPSSPTTRVGNGAPVAKDELIGLVGSSPNRQRVGGTYAVSFPKVQASFV